MHDVKSRLVVLFLLAVALAVAIVGIIIELQRSLLPLAPSSGQGVTTHPMADETTIITTPRQTPEDIIRKHLSTVTPELRSATIDVLYLYTNRSYTVLQETVYISAGSWRLVRLNYSFPLIYEITVRVTGDCIGGCDVEVEVLDKSFRLVWYFGRVSYLRKNLTILLTLERYSSEPTSRYYLKLDNSYSLFTPKTVHITVRAYVPADLVLNDKMFKIIAIANWVSENIRYISDPYKLEYIASPEETLRVKAGDCDDFAVLLASMYRAVGVRSAVGLIDTEGRGADHATALVALERTELDEFKRALEKYSVIFGYKTWGCVSYFNRDGVIWVIVDPPMSYNRQTPWCVRHEPYYLVKLIEP